MRSQFHRGSRLAVLLAVAVAASGCGAPQPSGTPASSPSRSAAPSPSSTAGSTGQPDLAVLRGIESQVEAIRGLHATKTVTPVLLSPTELRSKLTTLNAEQIDHAAMAAESRLYVDMGLLPAGSSLEKMELELDAGQVVGFYDTVSKGLYVLSSTGGVGPMEKSTFSHEYTHALQDQVFDLNTLATDAADQSDRDLARLAVPEGDATLTMSNWELANLSPIELMTLAFDSMSGTQTEQLNAAPAILRRTLLYPYTEGLTFVQGVYDQGGWAAVNKLYANPPDSTSQILHPALYVAGVKPISVKVPATVPASLGSGWKLTLQDTMGEFQLRVWLEREHPDSAALTAAATAASEWGGDRVALYEGPNGAWAVVLRTEWRTTAGAAAFSAAARQRLDGMAGQTRMCTGSTTVDAFIASDGPTVAAISTC